MNAYVEMMAPMERFGLTMLALFCPEYAAGLLRRRLDLARPFSATAVPRCLPLTDF